MVRIRGGQVQEGTLSGLHIEDRSINGIDINTRTIDGENIKLNTIKNENIDSTDPIAHSKLDISWLPSVADDTELPSVADNGDVVVAIDTALIYVRKNNIWTSSTGGGSYTSTDFNSDLATKTTDNLSEGITNKYFYNHDNTQHTESYITSSGVTYTNLNTNGSVGTGSTQVSAGNHDHSGVYEPVFSKNTAFNKDFGTVGGTISEGSHNHNSVYLRLDGTSNMSGALNSPSINITSVHPSDTATIFGSESEGNSILHVRIGNGSTDKIQFESWNGSSSSSLFEIDQTDVTILGNLNVTGTTTTIDSTTINVSDNEIILNSGVTGAPTLNASIIVNRGTSTDSEIKWNESTDNWEVGLVGSTKQILTVTGTKTSGEFYTGTTNPSNSTRLNYDGNLHCTNITAIQTLIHQGGTYVPKMTISTSSPSGGSDGDWWAKV